MPQRTSSQRIPRVTYASMVGERLRADILEGAVRPGSQLHEVELAESFGVSRGPVREALQRLIQEGLLRAEPHRGVFVPVMTSDDVEDIYLVREALESTAVRQIMASTRAVGTADDLDAVCMAMRAAEDADDWQQVANLDLDFHTTLVGAARSPRLERSFTTVISETRLCLGMLTSATDDLVEEHRRIADALRGKDVELALAVLGTHFRDAVVSLRHRLEQVEVSRAG